ncbi:hypothetical protein IAR55_001902 [Kwoniella newhampshirensis]|uniref:SEC63 domain-containing protein n=1 Tax=Kwoniella newhampshirensis TaxID=1651941 RepID=A0AAW0Z3N0_9TREE
MQTMMAIHSYAHRIARAMVQYASNCKYGKATRSALELYRTTMGKSWEDSPCVFRQIDTIGPKSIKALGVRGILTDKLELEATFHRTREFVMQVLKQAKALPRFNVTIVEENLDRNKHELQLRVTIKPMSQDMNLTGKAKRTGYSTGYNLSALFLRQDSSFIMLRRISAVKLKDKASDFLLNVSLTKRCDKIIATVGVIEYETKLDDSVYPPDLEPEAQTPEPVDSSDQEDSPESQELRQPNENNRRHHHCEGGETCGHALCGAGLSTSKQVPSTANLGTGSIKSASEGLYSRGDAMPSETRLIPKAGRSQSKDPHVSGLASERAHQARPGNTEHIITSIEKSNASREARFAHQLSSSDPEVIDCTDPKPQARTVRLHNSPLQEEVTAYDDSTMPIYEPSTQQGLSMHTQDDGYESVREDTPQDIVEVTGESDCHYTAPSGTNEWTHQHVPEDFNDDSQVARGSHLREASAADDIIDDFDLEQDIRNANERFLKRPATDEDLMGRESATMWKRLRFNTASPGLEVRGIQAANDDWYDNDISNVQLVNHRPPPSQTVITDQPVQHFHAFQTHEARPPYQHERHYDAEQSYNAPQSYYHDRPQDAPEPFDMYRTYDTQQTYQAPQAYDTLQAQVQAQAYDEIQPHEVEQTYGAPRLYEISYPYEASPPYEGGLPRETLEVYRSHEGGERSPPLYWRHDMPQDMDEADGTVQMNPAYWDEHANEMPASQ